MAGGLICASPAYAGHAVGEEQGRDPSWDQPIATGGIQNAFRFCAGRSDVALFGSRVILVVDRRRREMEVPVEIGRASCRERVCQYVWISVVAVSLKKKQKTAQQDYTNQQ